jgi:hypothetical protein
MNDSPVSNGESGRTTRYALGMTLAAAPRKNFPLKNSSWNPKDSRDKVPEIASQFLGANDCETPLAMTRLSHE